VAADDFRNRVFAALDASGGTDPPDPIHRPPSEGVFSDLFLGAGRFILERTPGVREALPKDMDEFVPDTRAAKVGEALPGIGLSMLAPGAGVGGMAAQGLIAGGLEALREDSTAADIAVAGGTSAALTGLFDVGGRAVKGMAGRLWNRYMTGREQILRTQSEGLRTAAETLGGLGAFNRAQQRVINRAAVEAIGETGDALTPEIRRAAASRIGRIMDEALPTGRVDVTEAFTVLDDIPASVLPGKARILELVQRAEVSPRAYQDAARALRDAGRTVARSPNSAFADEVFNGLHSLTTAGEAAGAANTSLVREQYKNLILLESIPTVRRTFQVPALSAESALYRGYGGGVSRTAGERLSEGTRRFIETTQAAAEEAASRFRSSGTSERLAQTEVAQDAVGLLTGSTSPSSLARTAGTLFGVGPLLGAAAMGSEAPVAGRTGAAAAAELKRRLDEQASR